VLMAFARWFVTLRRLELSHSQASESGSPAAAGVNRATTGTGAVLQGRPRTAAEPS
jgi:hypothetical protein